MGRPGNKEGGPDKDETFAAIYKRLMTSKKIKISVQLDTGELYEREVKSGDYHMKEIICAIQIMKAIKGDTRVAEMIADRTEGKPKQSHEVVGGLGGLSKEEVKEMLEGLKNEKVKS